MKGLLFKIVAFFLILVVVSCNSGVRLFRPHINCRYPANYGVIYVAKDTVNGNFKITYISYLDSDTTSFNVNSYVSSTLIYLKGYSGIGYMDSSDVLNIKGISGSNLMSIQFAWPIRMLVYDNETSELWGIVNDSVSRLINFNLPNMSTNFSLKLAGYEIDTNVYFLDAVNKIYYFGARKNDSLWLIGVSSSEQSIVFKNVLPRSYLGIKYNYWTNLAVGLASNGQTYGIYTFSPQDMTEKSQGQLNEQGIVPRILSFDYAGQNLVIGQTNDTMFNLLYVEPKTCLVKEVHKLPASNLFDCLAWSSMPY